jgi:High potential iron-sulfur protein
MTIQRRTFVIHSLTGAGALALSSLGGHAFAQAAMPMVQETEAQAVSLGYKADATKVDKVKFPKYAAGQMCANCTLYQGKAADAAGGCAIFAGKQVAAKGWCSAWVKKAA